MKKLTDKQKIKSYQKQLAKITSLTIFFYASQKVSTQFLDPSKYKDSDLHTIVTGFQKIMNYLGDDFRRIANLCGIKDKEIDEICDDLMEKFKKSTNYPIK